MNQSETTQAVISQLRNFVSVERPLSIGPDTSLDTLGIDSTALVMLLLDLEEKLHLDFEHIAYGRPRTVSDLIDLAKEAQKGRLHD